MAAQVLELAAARGGHTLDPRSDVAELVRDLALALIAVAPAATLPNVRPLILRAERLLAPRKPRRRKPERVEPLTAEESAGKLTPIAEHPRSYPPLPPCAVVEDAPIAAPPPRVRRDRRAARAPRHPGARRARHLGRPGSAPGLARSAGHATSASSPPRRESPAASASRS